MEFRFLRFLMFSRVRIGVLVSLAAGIWGFSPAGPVWANGPNSFASYLKFRNPIIRTLIPRSYGGLQLALRYTPYFRNKIPGLQTVYEIPPDRSSVTIEHRLMGKPVLTPVILPFDEYLSLRYSLEKETQRKQFFVQALEQRSDLSRRGGGIGFDIPIPIKSQAFQRIFGGNTVGLKVVGNVTIDGGLRHEKRSQVKTAINRQSDYNFRMKQTQRFTVKGNIGQKVNVYVDQDSERPFEFENAIRLEYKGFEDEIVESIQAGNVALSLPASRFVTFSAKNSGLFGIKANMRLGNLKMTVIASQEKGQKKKLTITGGATSEENKINDYEYRAGTYFFLNYYYREQFKKLDNQGNHIYDPRRSIKRIEVYKSEDGYQSKVGEGAVYGWAIAYPDRANPENPDTTVVDQNHYNGYFIRLEQTEYFVEKDLGYIVLEQPLRKGEVLAVAYEDSSGNVVGDIDYQGASEGRPIILQLLRTKNPLASDYTWDLEWKNVYYLGTRNIDKEGFELKIYYKPPSGDPQETININGKPVSYLSLLGLDRRDLNGNPNPDNLLDDDPNIINWARGELIFPDLEPFNSSVLPEDKRVPAIYDTTDYQYITQHSNFYISVSTKVRQTTYSLGFNVIEGSEEIILNGRRLQPGKDYIIDYFSGNLTILDEQASDPNASLEISYESNQAFQVDRKTILGARWDYELFNNSFIGGTFLYLNQSTLDQKIRIGQEGPMRNFVWNLNGQLNFEPYFVTKALNALPLIQTKEPTTLRVEGEIAEIIPNPNTRNSPDTDDPNGVMYIDDFEGSKRETPLGVMRRQWTICSVPKVIPGWLEYNVLPHDSLKNKSRGRLIWYNPYEQVSIKEIWPERDVNPNVPQRVHVLTMRFVRKPEYGMRSWGGIMRYLSAGYADQSSAKFLEVWVKGDEGRLHIDFGQISEDAIPNGKLNTEDKLRNGIRNGILDPDEDTGLDGVKGKDGENVPGDSGDDDWSYRPPTGYLIPGTTIEGSRLYEHINGTEGNLNDEGGRFPDTEDLNQNGSLDLRNDYFEYSFSLDKNSPDTVFIAGGLGLPPERDYGWRLYRIPLAKPDTVVGNPQWTNIEYVRIWIDEAPSDTIILSIAEIKLVGSEWKERGLAYSDLDTVQYDVKNDSTVRVTVVNTYDNPDYDPPPGVASEVDPITKVQLKEQALVLKVTELPPGANGIIQKAFFQPQSYINYNKMKMFVYGKDPYGTHIRQDSSDVVLFFRFGANEHNYYEFRERVYPGWDKRNEMIIDFEELTALKNKGVPDEYGRITGVTKDGDTLRVVGRPSLTNVRQLIVGVINYHPDTPFTGEIWLNELRLSDVKKDRGKAMRARMDLRLADLGTVNAEFNRIDDDFRTVNERFGKGNNQLRGSVNASFRLDKLLPPNLGLSIPVNMSYQRSEASPKYFPGSDIIVSKKTATDSLLEAIKTVNNRKALSVSFKKTSRSHNPLLKYTLDALSIHYSYAESFMSNSIIKQAKIFRYSGNINYSVAFKTMASFRPFGWLGNGPIVKALSRMRFYYLPKRFNYKISFNRLKDTRINRNGLVTPKYSFVIDQTFSTGLQPLKSLSIDYSRSHVNDLRQILDPYEVFRGKMGPLTSVRQTIRMQFSPRISTWLRITSSMNTNFNYNNNIQQKTLGKSASNNVNYNVQLTFDPRSLVQKFMKARPRTASRRPAAARRRLPTARKKEELDKDKKKEDTKKKKRTVPAINPLRLFGLIGSKLKPITIRYSQRISSNNYGLMKIPPLAFQIGKSFDPGPIIQQNVGSNRGSFNRGYNIDAQSGVQLSPQIMVTLKYNYANSYNRTTTTTGNITDTKWKIGGAEIPVPNWSFRWSGLEKFPLLSRFAQSVSLDHNRTGRLVVKWQDTRDNAVNRTLTLTYRPFVGLNIRLKNGMTATLQYNRSFSESINLRGGVGGTRKRSSDINATLTYSKRGGLKLSIPFFGKKQIRNNIDFSMTFVMSKDVSEQKRGQTGKYEEWTRNEKWSITPRLTYSFSSTVRGGIRFEFGRTKNKLYGETRIIELGINVNIQISGS